MKKAQVTAEKTAWLEVITHAQSHLTSAKIRSRYDRTLAQETEESFETPAEFAVKGLSRLDPGTQSALIEEAAAMGITSGTGSSTDRPDLPAIERRLRSEYGRPRGHHSRRLRLQAQRRPMSMARPSSAYCDAAIAPA